MLARHGPPDRKKKKKKKKEKEKKLVGGVFQTPNGPLGNSWTTMKWQSVVWKKRSGPFSRKRNALRCERRV